MFLFIIILVSNYADEVWLLTRPQGFNVFSVTHSLTHSLTLSLTHSLCHSVHYCNHTYVYAVSTYVRTYVGLYHDFLKSTIFQLHADAEVEIC